MILKLVLYVTGVKTPVKFFQACLKGKGPDYWIQRYIHMPTESVDSILHVLSFCETSLGNVIKQAYLAKEFHKEVYIKMTASVILFSSCDFGMQGPSAGQFFRRFLEYCVLGYIRLV